MMRSKPLDLLALGLRVALGGWFGWSGGTKIFGSGLHQFTIAIENYHLLSGFWVVVVAYVLPWAELAIGLCLVLGLLRRGALLSCMLMVCAFLFGVVSAWSRGLDIACGCFGGLEPMKYGWKVAELSGYLLVLGFVWWRERRGMVPGISPFNAR